MNRITTAGSLGIWIASTLVLGHCASPPTDAESRNAQHATSEPSRPASGDRAGSTSRASVPPMSVAPAQAGLHLPSQPPPSTERHDNVLTRILPSEITVSSGNGPGRNWFDGDGTTSIGAAGEVVEVTLRHTSVSADGIRVRGPLNGRITVSTVESDQLRGAAPTTESATAVVRLDGPTWQSINFARPRASATVTIRFEPALNSLATVSEVELWGRAPESTVRPQRWLADRLATSTESLLTHVASPASYRISAIEQSSDSTAGEFVVRGPGEGLRCARAFLRYELQGISHWTGISRTLNGVSLGAAYEPAAIPSGGVQLEEIAPALLVDGENRLRFLPSDGVGASGYRVENVSLLCAQDVHSLGVDQQAVTHPLVDDDRTTGMQGDDRSPVGPLAWSFASPSQLHSIGFYLGDATNGSLSVRAEGSVARHRVALAGRQPGWHSVSVPDEFAAASTVWVEANIARESAGRLAEVRLVGSPVASTAHAPQLVVTYPHHGECYDEKLHVRGFLQGVSNPEQWSVRVQSQSVRVVEHGIFALTAQQTAGASDDSTQLEVVAVRERAEGVAGAANEPPHRLSTMIPFARCTSAPVATVESAREDVGAPFGVWVHPERESVLNVGDFRVEFPRGSVVRPTHVTLRPLARSEMASLDASQGMTNVTRGAQAYRLGPHPMQFLAPLKITIPMDSSAIPSGKTQDEVGVYFFDEVSQQWRQLSRDVGVRPETVTAVTDHFTDFIAATAVSPEGGEGGAGDQNAMGSAGGGNPRGLAKNYFAH